MGELEEDLRQVMLGGDAVSLRLGDERMRRARSAAAYLAAHERSLREQGLLSFGEKLGDLHLAPALEEALLEAWSQRSDP